MIPPRIVIATSNAHKVDELRQLAERAGADTTLVAWNEVDTPFDIDETGHTFEENAYIKALAVYEQIGLPVIADDSGLEVDALSGAPGVRSARYAGENATDEDNRRKLLASLVSSSRVDEDDAAQQAQRTAAFRCVLCYHDGHRTVFGEGSVSGSITTSERGANGFGYDALFVPENEDLTFGEMTSVEKHVRSHRSRAFDNLIKNLQSQMSTAPPLSMFLIQVSIAAATQNEALLRSATRQAFAIHANDNTSHDDARRSNDDARTSNDVARCIYEAVLQTYLFAGYPSALDGLVIVAEECKAVLGTQQRHSDVEPFDVDLFRKRGTALCQTIYGNVFDKLMAKLEGVSPDLRDWMIVEGYGKTLSRPGLDIVTRELCVVGVLAATGRNTQLYSHVRGAVHVGASADDLALCIDVVTECDSAEHANAIRTVMESISI